MSGGTDATAVLRALGRRVALCHVGRGDPRAALLVGSAATGDADTYSDLDLLVYYDQVPQDDAVAETTRELGPRSYRGTPWSDESGEPDERGYSERYTLDGIECQVGHMSVGAFEREIARVVDDLELSEELLKIMSGLFEAMPLHGEELVGEWREKARYTDRLQQATIEKRWKLFPWWYFERRLESRDASVWRYDVLVQSTYAIVGALAALNGVYFSTLEFKRMNAFLARLELGPPDLAARLSALFELEGSASITALETVVADTQALIADRFPNVDLSLEWSGKPTPVGAREQPWA
jgi:hypothetical protein